MTTQEFLRMLQRFRGSGMTSIWAYPLVLTAILGLPVVLTGCTGEVLSEAFGVPQSSSQPPASPPGQHNAMNQELLVTPPDLITPTTQEHSRHTDSRFNQERKETRSMWFTNKSGSVEHVSAADFRTAVLEADGPVLVDFYADWCGPCRALAPVLEQLAQEIQGVRIVKVNVDQAPNLAAQYRVSAIPTLILFDQGKPVQRMTGLMTKEELKRALAVN